MRRSLLRGIRAGGRLFVTSPGLAVSAVLAIALGIGFTCTMFGIVHGATRSLPVAEPDEIVAVEKTALGGQVLDLDARVFDYQEWTRAQTSFEALGAFATSNYSLADAGAEPERVSGAAVTANAFAVLGVGPSLGRGFGAQDGPAAAVIISDALWRHRLQADPQVLGRTLRVDGLPRTIVGVMPPRFGFPVNAALWVPLDESEQAPGRGPRVRVFGRLGGSVTAAAASAELSAITRGLATRAPETHAQVGARVYPFTEIETPREVITALYLLVLAASAVLLIACGNVATLFVARSVTRASDVAVRLAIGGSRRHIVVEQLGEAIVLCGCAAMVGVAVAYAGTRIFAVNTAHIIAAFWVDIRVDRTVLLAASLLSLLAAVASALGPAWRAASANVLDALKDRAAGASSVRASRLSRGLIGVEVALACALLAITALLASRSAELRTIRWPFDPHRIATFELGIPPDVSSDPERRLAFLAQIEEQIAAVPGVTASGLATALPGRGAGSWTFSLDERAAPGTPAQTWTGVTVVSPGYFRVLGAPALTGRLLTAQDGPDAEPVAVVNESFVRRFSSDRSPLDRRFILGRRTFRIVGVVADLRPQDIQDARQDAVYLSLRQYFPGGVRVLASGPGEPMALIPSLRRAVASVDPDVPLIEAVTLHEAVYLDKRVLDVLSLLFVVFGSGALALTTVGLYGVLSFAVAQRQREIGIRLALGAPRRRILGLVVGQGMWQVGGGLAGGLVLAFIMSRAFAAAVEALDPPGAAEFAGIAAAVAIASAGALILPVRRALRTEIVSSLRQL